MFTFNQAAGIGLAARHQLTGKGLLPLGSPGRLVPLRRHRLRYGGHRHLRLGLPQLHLHGGRPETLLAARAHLPSGTKFVLNTSLSF